MHASRNSVLYNQLYFPHQMIHQQHHFHNCVIYAQKRKGFSIIHKKTLKSSKMRTRKNKK